MRRKEGTEATPDEIKNVCANPKCNNLLSGNQQRYCRNACKMVCYRLRRSRKKLLDQYKEERALAKGRDLPELDFLINELDDLLKPDFNSN